MATPVVAAAYGALITDSSTREALDRAAAVLPSSSPRGSFVEVLNTIDFEASLMERRTS